MRFTWKAYDEMDELGVDEPDALEVLGDLSMGDFVERLRFEQEPFDWLYVFKPVLADLQIYVKVAVRQSCIVISFHEDNFDGDDEGE